MSTTEERIAFEKLTQQAEQDYQQHPKKYQNKIKRLMWLGHGYLLFVLTLLFTLVAASVVLAINTSWFWLLLIKKKLIFVLFFLIYVAFKALFLKIPPPEGHRITRSQAPRLFEHLEQFRQQLKTPKIHEVVISSEFNAAIQQTPRLGLLGWHKNTLILGAPLLMCLNKKQTLAVMAHEMGHLAGNHSKFNASIYRARLSWAHTNAAIHEMTGFASWMFKPFIQWFVPHFSAYTFTLARANEYQADEVATQLTSTNALSEALTKVHVLPEILIEPFWQQLQRLRISTSSSILARLVCDHLPTCKVVNGGLFVTAFGRASELRQCYKRAASRGILLRYEQYEANLAWLRIGLADDNYQRLKDLWHS